MREFRGVHRVGETEHAAALRLREGVLEGTVDGVHVRAEGVTVRGGAVEFRLGGRAVRAVVAPDGDGFLVHVDGCVLSVAPAAAPSRRGSHHRAGEDDGRAASPMTGTVMSVDVAVGAEVAKGATLAVVEAMKMQFVVRAPRDLVVSAVKVRPGQAVDIGATLVEFA